MKKILFLFLSLNLVIINGCKSDKTATPSLTETISKFYKTLIEPTRDELASFVSDSLSYGHSSATIENKAQFIETLMEGKSNFLLIDIKDQTVHIQNNTAVVRHNLYAKIHDKDKPEMMIALHILSVWELVDGKWILWARQAVKI